MHLTRKSLCFSKFVLISVFTCAATLAVQAWSATLNRDDSNNKQSKPAQNTSSNQESNTVLLQRLDGFLDAHPQIRSDLIKNPKLVDNENYMVDHPEFADFLHTHGNIQRLILNDPQGFMAREKQYEKGEKGEKSETSNNGNPGKKGEGRRPRPCGNELNAAQLGFLNDFLDKHPDIRADLTKNPKLVRNEYYVINHPDLDRFFDRAGCIYQQIVKDPEGVMAKAKNVEEQQKH